MVWNQIVSAEIREIQSKFGVGMNLIELAFLLPSAWLGVNSAWTLRVALGVGASTCSTRPVPACLVTSVMRAKPVVRLTFGGTQLFQSALSSWF